MLKSSLCSVALGVSLAALASSVVAADNFPNAKPLTMIVPFAAGGPTDAVARSLAEAMREKLGQTVVVENVGGAGGTIGASRVASATPDGYTLLLAHVGITTAPALYAKLRFDPVKDFSPIGLVADLPMLFLARQDFPAASFSEFVRHARSTPGGVSIANAGVGSASHLCSVLVMNAVSAEFQPVPYKGIAPGMTDVLGKRVDAMCVSGYTPGLAVKTFAVTTKTRLAEAPDVPTMQEAGLKDFEMGIWHALWAPKGTPQPVIDSLAAAVQSAQANPGFRQRMKDLGTVVMDGQGNPAALDSRVKRDVAQWAQVLRKAGIQPQ